MGWWETSVSYFGALFLRRRESFIDCGVNHTALAVTADNRGHFSRFVSERQVD
jgi:hypothetical protein